MMMAARTHSIYSSPPPRPRRTPSICSSNRSDSSCGEEDEEGFSCSTHHQQQQQQQQQQRMLTSSSCACDNNNNNNNKDHHHHHHLGSPSLCYDPDCQDTKTLVDTVAELIVEDEGVAGDKEDNHPVLLAECAAVVDHCLVVQDPLLLVNNNEDAVLEDVVVPQVVATPIHHCDCERNVSWNRPEFLSATVVRDCRHQSFGLTFVETNGGNDDDEPHQLCIAQINTTDNKGLLSNSPFQVGDVLVSINKVTCAGLTVADLRQLLHPLTGVITIVVQNPGGDATLVESFLVKPSPSSKTGVGLKYSPRHNRLRIRNMHYAGLLVESLLQIEDRVLAINQIPCHQWDAQTAAQHIAESPRHVSIVARAHRDAGAVLTVQEPETMDKRQQQQQKSHHQHKRRGGGYKQPKRSSLLRGLLSRTTNRGRSGSRKRVSFREQQQQQQQQQSMMFGSTYSC